MLRLQYVHEIVNIIKDSIGISTESNNEPVNEKWKHSFEAAITGDLYEFITST